MGIICLRSELLFSVSRSISSSDGLNGLDMHVIVRRVRLIVGSWDVHFTDLAFSNSSLTEWGDGKKRLI